LICALVGITFAVAVPCILAAFEIQNLQNAWKKGWKEMNKKRNERKLNKRREKGEADEIKDFLE